MSTVELEASQMLQLHTVTEDERKRMASQHAIIPQADALAYGMVTARKANGGRKYPRTRAAQFTSDCVVTTADGSRYTIKRRTTQRNATGRPTGLTVDMLNAIADRRAKKSYASDQAAIGNID